MRQPPPHLFHSFNPLAHVYGASLVPLFNIRAPFALSSPFPLSLTHSLSLTPSPSANAIASVHVRATSYKSWFTFVPGSGASRNTRTNWIHPVARMHGRNPIRRNHTRFHMILDITDDRMVNGVTQDLELSSEATACVVYRGDGQIQRNRTAGARVGIKGSIGERVFACQKSISEIRSLEAKRCRALNNHRQY